MKRLLVLFLALALLGLPLPSVAAPGAHGPNGEHLDGPSDHGGADDGPPRMEAFSELFELIAHLEPDALVMMVNDYASNAPVDAAVVELDRGGLRVQAAFDPASGAYRFSAPELLAALAQPGTHSLAFSIDSGDEFDIVAGVLVVAEHEHPTHTGHLGWWLAALGGAALMGYAVLAVRRHQGRRAGVPFHSAGALS